MRTTSKYISGSEWKVHVTVTCKRCNVGNTCYTSCQSLSNTAAMPWFYLPKTAFSITPECTYRMFDPCPQACCVDVTY